MGILIIFSLFIFCKTSIQLDLCPENKPFRLNDHSCENLSSICFRSDYDQCNQLLNSCKQCPPSNITLTMLRNIWEISIVQSNLTQQILSKKITNKSEQFTPIMTNKSKDDSCAILLWIIVIILIILHFMETRFKLLTKCFQRCKRNDQYAIVKSRKSKYDLESRINQSFNNITNDLESRINQSFNNITNELEIKINQSLDIKRNVESLSQELSDKIDRLQTPSTENLDRKFESKFQDIMDKIDRLQTPSTDIKFATIQFQFDDVNQEPIELYVHNYHNIVQVKQQICAKLPHAKHDDYKITKLKYNGIILNDDNQYLLKNIDKSNTIINCFIDSSMNASDIVVVKLQGKMRLPDIIQINKNETIDQLKELIGKIIKSKDFSLFKEYLDNINQMKKTLLKLDSVCLEKELMDGDCIRIVQTIEGKLNIKSIFDESFCIPVAYNNTNQISTIIESVKNDYNWNPDNFVLFYNNQYLIENKYICEYDICADSCIKICNLAKIDVIRKHERCEADSSWELFHATKPPNNMKMLLKKYKNITPENWKSQDWMINELKTFLVTENHSRFIQLFGVYFDENSLYVAMENMENGTLKYYLKKNKNFEKTLIYKWYRQILEGLEYLHKNNIVHRDLNPSNILVNNEIDLKLSSFNLSKYEKIYEPPSFLGKPPPIAIKARYMAPELLNGEDYKFTCDIWSFGAVLVRIVSGKKPFPKMSEKEVKISVIKNEITEDKLFDIYNFDPKWQLMINSCMKRNPDERMQIENLLKD